jgi:hypothetical protein
MFHFNQVTIILDYLKFISLLTKSHQNYILTLKEIILIKLSSMAIHNKSKRKMDLSSSILKNLNFKTIMFPCSIVTNTTMMEVDVSALLMLMENSIFTLNFNLILRVEFFRSSISQILKLR